jgi:hypothetical protein
VLRAEPIAKPQSLRIAVRDAIIVLLTCFGVGAAANAVRPHGIPFVQTTEYQILVPCPEGSASAPAIAPDDPSVEEARTLLVDARSAADHGRWHPKAALSLPFDYLAPVPAAEVRRIASSGAARVVVFGDGGDPDSGEQLARELIGAGIRNVLFVPGGAPALEQVALRKGAP